MIGKCKETNLELLAAKHGGEMEAVMLGHMSGQSPVFTGEQLTPRASSLISDSLFRFMSQCELPTAMPTATSTPIISESQEYQVHG